MNMTVLEAIPILLTWINGNSLNVECSLDGAQRNPGTKTHMGTTPGLRCAPSGLRQYF